MKFLPSLKSAKALALVAATIATAIAASNVTSTLAQTPPTAGGLLQNIQDSTRPSTRRPGSIVFTNNNSNLLVGFQVKYMLDGKPQTYLHKNSEGRDFSAIPQTAIFNIPPQATNVIVVSQYWRGFNTLTISEQPVNPSSKTCFTVEYMAPFAPKVNNTCTVATTPPAPAPAPIPPVQESGRITFINNGGYVARYNVLYSSGGSNQNWESGNVTIGKKVTFNIPATARGIGIEGKYYTGLFNQTKRFFQMGISSASDRKCVTSSGNITFPRISNESCN